MINVVQENVDKLSTVYPSAQNDIYTERIDVLLHSAASRGCDTVPVRSA